MNKAIKAVLGFALCLCLGLTFATPAFAAEVTVRLSTAEDVLVLAESCRTDTYSDDLTVELMSDIDMSGTDFTGIPTFGGVFKGNGYTISGISVTVNGSVQGFFRYIRETGEVHDLNIKGTVSPNGSGAYTGGIAGENAGRIENCSFDGEVSGTDNVGGIAGVNTLTGVITGCQMHGSVIGKHFAGGIAGSNAGVIRSCKNAADINTTAVSNQVELDDITLEALTGTEAANTVTDIGGIAGINSGVIRSGVNYGDVGYKLMGYNIGGIAGSHSGYMTSCTNHGQICGRKDVGGIVGQMEPVTNIEYTTDTLQILKGQVDTLGVLADQASANAQSGVNNVAGQIALLKDHAETAKEALGVLIPDEEDFENPQLPDIDEIMAAQNSLTESLAAMPGAIDSITEAVGSTAYGVSQDLQAVSGQIGIMSETIGNASENLGGSISDASDSDTADDLTGKVENSVNHGSVSGDGNIGGVAGTIAFENDLDPDEDVAVLGDLSMKFSGEIRSVLLGCRNEGAVTVKKQNGGGVIGWQSLGLVKSCTNTGDVSGESATYVGGIAGLSSGFLRSCGAKCFVIGDTYVGGIAGEGDIVSDSRSMVSITGSEKTGAVLGYTDDLTDITGNCYLAVSSGTGAVDGINYTGVAEAKSHDDFFALVDVPAEFLTVTVKFVFDDGRTEIVQLPHGSKLDSSLIPEIPEKDGHTGFWAGLEDANLDYISFDAVFYTEYEEKAKVIESAETDEMGMPILFAQGVFDENGLVESEELRRELPLGEKQDGYITGRHFTVTGGTAHGLRVKIGDGFEDAELLVKLTNTNGETRTELCRVEGTYAVFDIAEDDCAFAVFRQAQSYTAHIICAAALVVCVAFVVILVRRKKKKSKTAVV